ncbi:MAG TPA: 3-deoxy-7-phosphoheptulonate synthase [Acholeplasmataceae bacterium]|nr:3-deoxy-7-phosphoheptulonate synthase [Acholeplasmataceae bacterium]
MYEKVRKYNKKILENNELLIIAGPCAVEEESRILRIAQFLKSLGVKYLRAGAYKPRTSPYTFQGLGPKGLEILRNVKMKTGIKIVSEIMDASQLEFYEDVDIIQVGARNMQNFSLLKALGKTNKTILLKRGFGATIDEWLYACEYLLNEGNDNVILCERGIKTFETQTRNTLDISSVPIVKGISKIPVIVDPSHSAGRSDIIIPLARAAVAVGADGLLIEMHEEPNKALSDKEETIDFKQFETLLYEIREIHDVVKKITLS